MLNIVCKIFGHKYIILKSFDNENRCLQCKRCGRFFAMNDGSKALLDWDIDFTKMYNFNPFEYLANKSIDKNIKRMIEIGFKPEFTKINKKIDD